MPESQAKLRGSLTNLILGQPEEPWEEKISKNGLKMAKNSIFSAKLTITPKEHE